MIAIALCALGAFNSSICLQSVIFDVRTLPGSSLSNHKVEELLYL